MLHHYVSNGRDSFRSLYGSVYYDAAGKRYFRAEHMSRMSTEEETMQAGEDIMAMNKAECVGWDLQVFPDKRDWFNLLNRLRPIHPTEVYTT
jgi:hypothetical protein